MKNICRIDHTKGLIIMDRTFAMKAENTRSEEYAHLQQVRKDYPEYTVIRRTIKKNSNKKTYKGLTYDYMRNYIQSCNATIRERYAILAEFDELFLISQCQSKGLRYPVIKQWFLEKFPEIEKFGLVMKEPENEDMANADVDDDTAEEEIIEEETVIQPEKKSA